VMRLTRTFLLMPLLAVMAACSSSPKAPEPGPLPDLPAERVRLERVWKVQVGQGPEALAQLRPAITAQQVVAASQDGVLSSHDAETGRVQWRNKTGLPLTAGPAAGYGMVVAGTGKGELLAYDSASGVLRWKVQVGAAVHAVPAVAVDRVVVLAADGVVHVLDSATGEQRWTYSTPVPPLSLRGSAGPMVVGTHVLVPTAAGKLMSLDMESGVVEWDVRVATNTGRSELERMVDIQGELLQDGDSQLYSVGFQSQLTALNLQEGRRRWQFDVSSVHSLAAGLGNVYVVDTSSTVVALDQESGKPVWKQPDLAWRGLINPVVLGPVVVIGDADGYAHVLSQSDGGVLGRHRLVRDRLASVAVRGDLLYAWSAEGVLSAWKIRQH
jgi:outer membrane protein assembly factor BamB